MSFIWDFTWVSIPSDTSSDSLWVVVTKISLFRCLLHVNATRKVVTVHLMRWQQLFLRSFRLSHLLFKSVGHVLLFWASWKVPLAVWDTNLRYAGHVQENFPPQTFLHVLLTYGALCWAFTIYWQSPRTFYCPWTGPWPNILFRALAPTLLKWRHFTLFNIKKIIF